MDESIFSALPAQTQDALAKLSDAVDGVLPIDIRSWPVDVSALPDEAAASGLVQKVADWADDSKACLYYFECRPPVDLARVERAFVKAKHRKVNRRRYPRLNAQAACIYVGSSQSVAKRLREHLGFGARGTYALQLVHWAVPLSLKLDFVCAKYPESIPTTTMQALEDTLWEIKRPMFGRQGRR